VKAIDEPAGHPAVGSGKRGRERAAAQNIPMRCAVSSARWAANGPASRTSHATPARSCGSADTAGSSDCPRRPRGTRAAPDSGGRGQTIHETLGSFPRQPRLTIGCAPSRTQNTEPWRPALHVVCCVGSVMWIIAASSRVLRPRAVLHGIWSRSGLAPRANRRPAPRSAAGHRRRPWLWRIPSGVRAEHTWVGSGGPCTGRAVGL